MKKLFRFTAVAVVAFALCMALPACDLIGGGEEDDSEQNGGDNGDDDDNAGSGEIVESYGPRFDFAGEWEAYEWYADDDVELDDFEAELMKEQTCVLYIRPTVEKVEYGGYYVRGNFDADLLFELTYDSPIPDSGTRSTNEALEIEHKSGWFEMEISESYIEDHGEFMIKRGRWLTGFVSYPNQDDFHGLGLEWDFKFDAEDSELATFRFGGKYKNARMRRISKY